MKRAVLISFVALFGITPNAATAQHAVASYSDLNLDLPADQARLERRVILAAKSACKAAPAPGSLLPTSASLKCARQAVAGARTQVAAAIAAQSAAKLAARTR